MDKLLEKILEIIKNHNGQCSFSELLIEIQKNYPEITQDDFNSCITANPTLLKRTPEEESCGIIIKEAGVSLTGGVVTMPKSANKKGITISKNVGRLPKNRNNSRKKK